MGQPCPCGRGAACFLGGWWGLSSHFFLNTDPYPKRCKPKTALPELSLKIRQSQIL